MKRTEQLLEDYVRRADTMRELIKETEYLMAVTVHNKHQLSWMKKLERLKTKLSCYNSFIAELQRIAV